MDNKLKIINYLGKHLGQAFTMHGLSEAIKVPYATFHRTIQRMKSLVTINEVGKAKTLVLNRDNGIIKPYLAISSEEEKQDFLKNQPLIRKLASELSTGDIVVLFGSYAKGTEKPSSDIDLLVINSKGNRSLSFAKFEILFKKKVNPLFVAKREFAQMLREKDENVGKQALKDHIILSNPEMFWEAVLHG